jgi:hypothetical protein
MSDWGRDVIKAAGVGVFCIAFFLPEMYFGGLLRFPLGDRAHFLFELFIALFACGFGLSLWYYRRS